jgi:hypothetical protein
LFFSENACISWCGADGFVDFHAANVNPASVIAPKDNPRIGEIYYGRQGNRGEGKRKNPLESIFAIPVTLITSLRSPKGPITSVSCPISLFKIVQY